MTINQENKYYLFSFTNSGTLIYFATDEQGGIRSKFRAPSLAELARKTFNEDATFVLPTDYITHVAKQKIMPEQSIHPATESDLETLLRHRAYFLRNSQPISAPIPKA